MQARDFKPSFRLDLAAKDAALVERAAREHGAELPLVGRPGAARGSGR